MVESTGQRRFRLSIRTLMIAVALCAVLLALAVWTVRHFEARVRLERLLAEQARDQAQRRDISPKSVPPRLPLLPPSWAPLTRRRREASGPD